MTHRFPLGAGVDVDLDKLIDTRLLVQGNSGSGKSWVLRRVLEQTYGRVQHLVIDPEGEFITLRERFDYVYAAPSGGDTVTHPRSAALLAEKLLDLKVSAILDIFELSPKDRVVFVRRFLEALVDAPRRLWHPALVVTDEAQLFCPEKGAGEAESTDAVLSLATRGRKRGFCAVFGVQRLSMFHKAAAAECNNKLIGRTTLDTDVQRAGKELGLPPAKWPELRTLDPSKGEWFAYGPALTPTVQRVSVGPVATTHPKAGARITFAAPPPTAKVLALLPKLADLPKEADERAKSIDDLKREVGELRRQLTAAKAAAAPAKIEHVEVAVLSPQHRADILGMVARMDTLGEQLDAEGVRLRQALGRTPSPGPPRRGAAEFARSLARDLGGGRAGETNGHVRETKAPIREPIAGGDEPIGESQAKILNALAWFRELGIDTPDVTAVACVAGYDVTGGRFNNLRSQLVVRGLVRCPASKKLELTDAGIGVAVPPNLPPTDEALHRALEARVSESEWKLLAPLLEAFPESLSNDALAAAAGYDSAGGRFNNLRSRLSSMGLVHYPQRGVVAARDILFPGRTS